VSVASGDLLRMGISERLAQRFPRMLYPVLGRALASDLVSGDPTARHEFIFKSYVRQTVILAMGQIESIDASIKIFHLFIRIRRILGMKKATARRPHAGRVPQISSRRAERATKHQKESRHTVPTPQQKRTEPEELSLDPALYERACAAWFRYCNRIGQRADSPGNSSYMLIAESGEYVVLANGDRTLAVFTIGKNDELRRVEVEDWPEEVESE
jgi:hypothetical protein